MSDPVKLLDQARALRDAARRTHAIARQLSGDADRRRVIRCARIVDRQAVRLERLAEWFSGTESKAGPPEPVAVATTTTFAEVGPAKTPN